VRFGPCRPTPPIVPRPGVSPVPAGVRPGRSVPVPDTSSRPLPRDTRWSGYGARSPEPHVCCPFALQCAGTPHPGLYVNRQHRLVHVDARATLVNHRQPHPRPHSLRWGVRGDQATPVFAQLSYTCSPGRRDAHSVVLSELRVRLPIGLCTSVPRHSLRRPSQDPALEPPHSPLREVFMLRGARYGHGGLSENA